MKKQKVYFPTRFDKICRGNHAIILSNKSRGMFYMKKKKSLWSSMVFIIMICITLCCYGHSGRTDANGGHRDNKNKSGLGSYHYHCGGHPAHLHSNGVCPYSSSSSNSGKKKSTGGTTNSKTKTTQTTQKEVTKPKTIGVEKVEITIEKKGLEPGETIRALATVSPDNATDKTVKWTSSNSNIAVVDEEGNITAKEEGKVKIIAISSNGKSQEIEMNVEKKIVVEDDTNTISNVIGKNETRDEVKNEIQTKKEDKTKLSNPIPGIITIGAAGGIGYWVYRKKKK